MDKQTNNYHLPHSTFEGSAMIGGDVNGGLTIHNHRSQHETSPPQKILYQLKPPVLSFEGREIYLHLIRNYHEKGNIVVLYGLGGTGKSELARKYADQHKSDYHSVIWLDAVTHESLASSIRSLYRRLIDDKKNIEKIYELDLMQRIYTRLQRQTVLLIIDDAKDLSSIHDYLLMCPAEFHILVTSNATYWNNDRLQRNINCEEINNFTEDEALSFIKSTLELNDDSQQHDVLDLAKTMNYLPLALQQATACIKQFNADYMKIGKTYTIRDYLNKFYEDPIFIQKDYTADSTKTVFRTFELTLEKLASNSYSETTLEIIDMMAYMSPNNIDIRIFRGWTLDEDELSKSISELKKFSIVKLASSDSLNMHGLVQLVRQVQLKNLKREYHVLWKLLTNLHKFVNFYNYNIITHIVTAWNYAYKHENLIKHFLQQKQGKQILFEYLLDGNKSKLVKYITKVINLKNAPSLGIHVQNINLEIIKILFEGGLDNRYCNRLVEIAVHQHAWDCAECLIIKRTQISWFKQILQKKIDLESILLEVCKYGKLDIIKMLLNRRKKNRKLLLHFAALYGRIDVVKYLVDDKHADVTATYSHGRTLLHWAAEGGHIDVMKYLVDDKHADVTATDSYGRTPLHSAARVGYIDVVKYLCDDKHADVNATDSYGQTPLHWAARGSHIDVVKYLVDDKHADVNATDSYGQTPLHWAAKGGHIDVVKYLVNDKFADVNATDSYGRTPRLIAVKRVEQT